MVVAMDAIFDIFPYFFQNDIILRQTCHHSETTSWWKFHPDWIIFYGCYALLRPIRACWLCRRHHWKIIHRTAEVPHIQSGIASECLGRFWKTWYLRAGIWSAIPTVINSGRFLQKSKSAWSTYSGETHIWAPGRQSPTVQMQSHGNPERQRVAERRNLVLLPQRIFLWASNCEPRSVFGCCDI